MPLLEGRYTLRASPAEGLGGMFATGQNEVDGIVTVAAQIPDTIGRQIWVINAVNGGDNVYVISMWTSGSTFGGAFSPSRVEPNPRGPVITSQHSQEWVIVPIETGISGTYTISMPSGPLIGVDYLVGTEDNKVVVKGVPVTREGTGKPYWKLSHID